MTHSPLLPLPLDLSCARLKPLQCDAETSGLTTPPGTSFPKLETGTPVLESAFLYKRPKRTPSEILLLLREFATYDNLNGGFRCIKTRKGSHIKIGESLGTKVSNGYFTLCVGTKNYLRSRLVWLWHYGDWPVDQIDHIDQDPANDRIENLRDVSNTENGRNRKLYASNKTGFVGVSYNKALGKYVSHVTINYKYIHLGFHSSPEEAFAARQKYLATQPNLGFTMQHGHP